MTRHCLFALESLGYRSIRLVEIHGYDNRMYFARANFYLGPLDQALPRKHNFASGNGAKSWPGRPIRHRMWRVTQSGVTRSVVSNNPAIVTWHRPVNWQSGMCNCPGLPIHSIALCIVVAQAPDAESIFDGLALRFSLHGHARRLGPQQRDRALPAQARFCRDPG